MAHISIFRAGQPDVAGILVDTRVRESHSATAEATRFPIDGAEPDLTEHIILNPREITIEAIISNIDGPNIPAVGERAKAALADFQRLRDERGALEILTHHALYESMALTSLEATHEGTATGELKYSIGFTQMTKVAAENLPIPAATVSAGNDSSRSEVQAAASTVDAGRKTSNESSQLFTLINGGVVQ